MSAETRAADENPESSSGEHDEGHHRVKIGDTGIEEETGIVPWWMLVIFGIVIIIFILSWVPMFKY